MVAAARSPYSYEEIDTDALPPSRRVEQEPGWLPMQADPTDNDARRRFRIQLRRLSGPAARFADLTATPMKLSRARSHCHRDGMDMVSLTLMLDHDIEHQSGEFESSIIVQPGQILVKDFAETAAAWWPTCVHRGLNLHLPHSRCGHRQSKLARPRHHPVPQRPVPDAESANAITGGDHGPPERRGARGSPGGDSHAGNHRASCRTRVPARG